MKETKTARGEHIYIQDCSECGSLITPRARALQDPDPSVKKLCFNCLLHKRKIRTVERRKDGWVS